MNPIRYLYGNDRKYLIDAMKYYKYTLAWIAVMTTGILATSVYQVVR